MDLVELETILLVGHIILLLSSSFFVVVVDSSQYVACHIFIMYLGNRRRLCL